MVILQIPAMSNPCSNNFRKTQRNKANIFWKKCNSVIKNGKL